MKNNIEKVYGKLPKKVNLKKQNVKLNLAFDLATVSSTANVFVENISIDIDEFDRIERETEQLKISLEVDIEDLDATLETLQDKLNQAENMAEELGVDVSALNNYENAKETYDTGLIRLDRAKEYLNQL